jgi:uncharacterized protein YkwD
MRTKRLLVQAAVVAAVTLGLVPTARAAQDERGQLVSLMNARRAAAGEAPLRLDAQLSASACNYNAKLVKSGVLAHDPNLAAAGDAFPGWTKVGENLAMAGDVTTMYNALAASPGHLANIIEPSYTIVGVCMTRNAAGELVSTQRFIALPNGFTAAAAGSPAPVRTTQNSGGAAEVKPHPRRRR